MDVSLLQPENALFPTEVTDLGMLMEVKPLQLRNAPFPIEVTEFGILMEVKPLQFSNAISAIPVVPAFRAIVVLAGIVPLYTYAILLIYINPSG